MSAITSRTWSLAELNALPAEEFAERVGAIFERSPWIAERAAMGRPWESADTLLKSMQEIVATAPLDRKLALISAHPDLGGRIARQGQVTAESTAEQASAGLTRIDSATRKRIDDLNTAYRERFGFPFIICARLNNVKTIIGAMERRLNNGSEQEVSTALTEISKIARLRLMDLLGPDGQAPRQ